jgi:hypothetical protein
VANQRADFKYLYRANDLADPNGSVADLAFMESIEDTPKILTSPIGEFKIGHRWSNSPLTGGRPFRQLTTGLCFQPRLDIIPRHGPARCLHFCPPFICNAVEVRVQFILLDTLGDHIQHERVRNLARALSVYYPGGWSWLPWRPLQTTFFTAQSCYTFKATGTPSRMAGPPAN